MNAETTTDMREQAEMETAWHAFEYWTATRDEAHFRGSYLGRFDGEAVLKDFEVAGHFWVYEAPAGGGAFVFDAQWSPEN